MSDAKNFCERYRLSIPVLEAPMAGASSVSRAAAIANAGGMGALGALLLSPQEIKEWAAQFRALSQGPLQINLWVPDPLPTRDRVHESKVRAFLSQWGPSVDENVGDAQPPDFTAQCEALLAARPRAASSIMGLFPPDFVRRLKVDGIAWFATATTLAEAKAAEAAGADAVIAQGFEAGGHRGAFDNTKAEQQLVGSMSLLPRLADNINVPIIAAGGVGDARGIAAALTLGASAVVIGSVLLKTKESETPKAWVDALEITEPENTWPTRAFSGRLGRAIATDYVRAANVPDTPRPAPYPVQRALTAKMRAEATRANDISRMQAWAGQSAWMPADEKAGGFVERVWTEAEALLR